MAEHTSLEEFQRIGTTQKMSQDDDSDETEYVSSDSDDHEQNISQGGASVGSAIYDLEVCQSNEYEPFFRLTLELNPNLVNVYRTRLFCRLQQRYGNLPLFDFARCPTHKPLASANELQQYKRVLDRCRHHMLQDDPDQCDNAREAAMATPAVEFVIAAKDQIEGSLCDLTLRKVPFLLSQSTLYKLLALSMGYREGTLRLNVRYCALPSSTILLWDGEPPMQEVAYCTDTTDGSNVPTEAVLHDLLLQHLAKDRPTIQYNPSETFQMVHFYYKQRRIYVWGHVDGAEQHSGTVVQIVMRHKNKPMSLKTLAKLYLQFAFTGIPSVALCVHNRGQITKITWIKIPSPFLNAREWEPVVPGLPTLTDEIRYLPRRTADAFVRVNMLMSNITIQLALEGNGNHIYHADVKPVNLEPCEMLPDDASGTTSDNAHEKDYILNYDLLNLFEPKSCYHVPSSTNEQND